MGNQVEMHATPLITPATPVERNNSLQIYRGFAAISVVLFHATCEIEQHFNMLLWNGVFSYGFSGVHLFFVLSGFIIAFIHHKDIGRHDKILPYIKKRFVRIYPVYWIILAFYLPNIAAEINRNLTHTYIIQNIFLIRTTNHEFINVVAWTLSHEILFYCMFTLLLVNSRVGIASMLAWGGILITIAITGWEISPPYLLTHVTGIDYGVFTNLTRLFTSPINLLFLMGIGSYLIYNLIITSGHRERIALWCFFLGIISYSISSLYWLSITTTYTSNWSWTYPLFGFASLLLIIGTASKYLDTKSKNKRHLLLLGDASYSIYLVHYGIMMSIGKILGTNITINAHLYFAILVTTSIAIGTLFYIYIEGPILNYLGKRRNQTRFQTSG